MSSSQPPDRRVRRTRRLLQRALLLLLQDEPLEKVTVSQIAARADVSRQAFYLHFRSKEELLLSHIDDVSAEIRAALLSLARTRSLGIQDLLAAVFREWAAHASSLRAALQMRDKEVLIERIRLQVDEVMMIFGQYGRGNVYDVQPRDYVVDFYAGGLYMLLRSWDRDGLAVTPADMAAFTDALIPQPQQSHAMPRRAAPDLPAPGLGEAGGRRVFTPHGGHP